MSLGVPTDRQLDILMFIIGHRWQTGMSPTIREIGAKFGIRSPNGVVCHLDKLRQKGLISYDRGANVARSIVPTVRFFRFFSAEQLENSNGGNLAAGE